MAQYAGTRFFDWISVWLLILCIRIPLLLFRDVEAEISTCFVVEDFRNLRLPIFIIGRSVVGMVFRLDSVLVELLLLRSGDRFHHFCLDAAFRGRRISRSAQYPSGNQTHSQPALGERGGSIEWFDKQPADDGVVNPILFSFQSRMDWLFVIMDCAELMEFLLVRGPRLEHSDFCDFVLGDFRYDGALEGPNLGETASDSVEFRRTGKHAENPALDSYELLPGGLVADGERGCCFS